MSEVTAGRDDSQNRDAYAMDPNERIVRHGRISWFTHPLGHRSRRGESFAFGVLPIRLDNGASRAATPGELLAVTHATFMATNLAEALRLNGSTADEIVVEAACSFSGPLAKPRLLALALTVYGRVPGIDAAGFRQVAAEARRSPYGPAARVRI
jgi:hypothetical protein